MYFDRFDICEAHFVLELEYNVGGVLWERPANRDRKQSSAVQLQRIGFTPGVRCCSRDGLSENGQEIYDELLSRYGLDEVSQ